MSFNPNLKTDTSNIIQKKKNTKNKCSHLHIYFFVSYLIHQALTPIYWLQTFLFKKQKQNLFIAFGKCWNISCGLVLFLFFMKGDLFTPTSGIDLQSIYQVSSHQRVAEVLPFCQNHLQYKDSGGIYR